MDHSTPHISSYRSIGLVLVALLFLTSITILVTWLDFGSLSVAVAMGVAFIKVGLVVTYFMHLKFDDLILRIFAGMVLLLLLLVFVITFFDYLFR
ncbi:cytochrome C oxidase subunit IV family protein [Williamwhitmania taraxaci]|uniref:Cytochrome c oxidase subunit 4 n=1 Tax=Williamwhitmania taraxaci TaxID=1640674 RepID=A0A1G6JX77_9BACT|nr:cytochrome C oxidase subunit IV family protein [Williamwhitmania taraxaci]SDC23324.1 cytochrome c oxidase subunit 4 [Williamwhitmania taraxaci]